jgi:hypothetical protein
MPVSSAVPFGRPLIQPQDRLGLSRLESSEFVGVGVTLFDLMVKDGRMPPPHQANSRLVWSRVELEKAFAALPYAGFKEQSEESNFDF